MTCSLCDKVRGKHRQQSTMPTYLWLPEMTDEVAFADSRPGWSQTFLSTWADMQQARKGT